MKLLCFVALLVLTLAMGCSQDTAKTRDEAAKTASKVKQESKEATKELKKGAEEAREQGKAIAEGVREGWNSDSKSVDLNSASKDQLMGLPGIDAASADRIMAARPYHAKEELTSRRIVSRDEYQKIQDHVTAK